MTVDEALHLAQRGAQRHRHPRAAVIDLQRERASCRAAQNQLDPRTLDDQAVGLLLGPRATGCGQTLSSHCRPRADKSALITAIAAATRAALPFMPSSSERR